jgi:transposase
LLSSVTVYGTASTAKKSQNQSPGQQAAVGRAARWPIAGHSCAGAELSRVAASGATARYAGGAIEATKQRIKSLLLYESISFPGAAGKWTVRALRELERLPCNATVRFKLDQLLDSLQFHYLAAAKVQKQIRRFCQSDAELRQCVRFLASLPGVGTITATHALARLGDWRQITDVRQIAGFLGLVSCEHSTGDKENRGEITRIGDKRLRSKLIQCAWTAIRKDPELRAFYRRVYERQPQKVAARKAIVAVARKLTTRMYAVLKQQRPFEIRADNSVAPLTTEETAGLGERLDVRQNQHP